MVAGVFLAAALGFIVPLRLAPAPTPTRTPQVALCAEPDPMQEAAARVIAAAERYGDTQGAAAAAWVEEAMSVCRGEECAIDTSELFDKQMMLFEECVIEDADMCKELDQALTDLEQQLKMGDEVAFDDDGAFGKSKLDRASARVRTAAAKFGPEQERIAALWVAEVRKNGSMNPFALLEQQMALFGECILDDDGGSKRCQELNQALGALQVSLGVRGKAVPTRGFNSLPSK